MNLYSISARATRRVTLMVFKLSGKWKVTLFPLNALCGYRQATGFKVHNVEQEQYVCAYITLHQTCGDGAIKEKLAKRDMDHLYS